MSLLEKNTFYLVGIKGVAMTALAQILIDAGKKVSGCDLEEAFVTQPILDDLNIPITVGFEAQLPKEIDCVVYTSAHSGEFNPMVVQAQEKGIVTLSHAQAQADLFNQKKGIAVCGVGGKSTVSAMLTWIFLHNKQNVSFSVGVGSIGKLKKTARWSENSEFFIAEADEYVTDPSAPKRGVPITPRFSFLYPHITICTNLKFDHPDVYQDFEHTKEVFFSFFEQITPQGTLILNHADLVHQPTTSADTTLTFGKDRDADFYYEFSPQDQEAGKTTATLHHDQHTYDLTLQIPGEYNIANAVCAIAGAYSAGISIQDAITALASFASTQRRFENRGTKNAVEYFDDYAHHPGEISAAILALNSWYKTQPKIVAFQPHTYSRTKQLLHEFIHAFKHAQTVYLLDIFASARESFDPSITSDDIVAGIKRHYPHITVANLKTTQKLAQALQESATPGSVVLTLGAGDIYKVHDLLT